MRPRRLGLALLMCAAQATLALAQSGPDLDTLQATLDQAISEFEGPQQGQSLLRFEEIIGRLETERRQGTLSEAGANLLVSAYEYRARVQFNVGNTDKASDSFRALIALRPQHTLDAALISPKVVDFFNAVKSQIVGYVTRTREVRIWLEGARDILQPGSLVSARLRGALGPDLKPADPNDESTWGRFPLIPKEAVLSTGVRHVAWKLSGRDRSGQMRVDIAPLALGPRLEDENGRDLFVVRAGLQAGDEVAAQGAFLLDSQAQLAGTPSLLYPQGAVTKATHQH